jgi:biopolymer transport protein ExbD
MQRPLPRATPRLATAAAKRRPVISLTPLIDVVFILLVFFMLASSFLDWRYVTMDTPAARAAAPSDAPALTLVVSGDGVRVDGEAVGAAEMIAAARQHLEQNPGSAVRLQPAGETSLQRVMDVLDALSGASLAPLALVRDPDWRYGETD